MLTQIQMFVSLMEDAKKKILEALNKKHKDFALIVLTACRLVPPPFGMGCKKKKNPACAPIT